MLHSSPIARRQTLLVAGWIGSTNLGDELVFAGLRRKLDALGVAAVPFPRGARALAAPPRAGGLVLGGGGLLQDHTSPFNLPYHLARVWRSRARGLRFAGVGLGAGPLETGAGRWMVRRSLSAAVAVSVRDPFSAGLVEATGLPRPVVAADLAFAMQPPSVSVGDRLVACLRPWVGRRGVLPARLQESTAPPWFVDGMARALDAASARTGLPVRLVALQTDRDDAVHRVVASRMSAPVSVATPNLDSIVDEIAAARVVVAMRYHGGVAAALGGRPAVLVGYSAKVGALADDLGGGARWVPWTPSGVAEVPSAVEAVMDRAAEMVEARERLRVRERGNDEVLDRLLSFVR